MEEYFTEQNIIINITLCGTWSVSLLPMTTSIQLTDCDDRAGNAEVFAQTCSGLCTDYIADPRNYDNVSLLAQSRPINW